MMHAILLCVLSAGLLVQSVLLHALSRRLNRLTLFCIGQQRPGELHLPANKTPSVYADPLDPQDWD